MPFFLSLHHRNNSIFLAHLTLLWRGWGLIYLIKGLAHDFLISTMVSFGLCVSAMSVRRRGEQTSDARCDPNSSLSTLEPWGYKITATR